MRLRYLLLWAVIGLTFSNSLSAQVNKLLATMTGDSLKGFDLAYHTKAATMEGLTGADFHGYIAEQQRAFINEKYGLSEPYASGPPQVNFFKNLGGNATVNN